METDAHTSAGSFAVPHGAVNILHVNMCQFGTVPTGSGFTPAGYSTK